MFYHLSKELSLFCHLISLNLHIITSVFHEWTSLLSLIYNAIYIQLQWMKFTLSKPLNLIQYNKFKKIKWVNNTAKTMQFNCFLFNRWVWVFFVLFFIIKLWIEYTACAVCFLFCFFFKKNRFIRVIGSWIGLHW